MVAPEYAAPWWLSRGRLGAHLQTLYPALYAPAPRLSYTRERWESTPHGAPDGDFIDVDRVAGRTDKPMLVVFHGLEGSSQSPYARALVREACTRGWRAMVPHFRGCSGELNRLPRAYHSGDAAEIDWILKRAKAEAPTTTLFAVGISLGGNATLKWLGEQNTAAGAVVEAVVSISAPLDLTAAGNALERGFCKFYTWNFLKTMKASALQKLAIHPGIFDGDQLRAAKTLRQFDNLVTAPLHGYRDTDDYWLRASAKPGLVDIAVPTLIINAKNDPFLPAHALPREGEVSPAVKLHYPDFGGHVGFMSAPFPGRFAWMPRRVFHFFDHRN